MSFREFTIAQNIRNIFTRTYTPVTVQYTRNFQEFCSISTLNGTRQTCTQRSNLKNLLDLPPYHIENDQSWCSQWSIVSVRYFCFMGYCGYISPVIFAVELIIHATKNVTFGIHHSLSLQNQMLKIRKQELVYPTFYSLKQVVDSAVLI